MSQTDILRFSDGRAAVAEILISTREIHQCSSCMTFVEPAVGSVCKGCGAVMRLMRRRQ